MILEVKNLKVSLEGEKIIENLSFRVDRGEILTILGPNGAGKSVLLKTLLGFFPYQGEIIWKEKARIGYLPQGFNQFKIKHLPLTVQDFFALKIPPPSLEEINHFLKQVGLTENLLNKKAGNLSGGEFQRMLIAWTLISRPQIIFFDEPTTGIDLGGDETIYSLLHTLWKKEKLTLFLVTHDLNIVYRYSTNVLCLNRKGYNCFGAPKEILSPQVLEKLFGTEIKFYEHH